VKQRHCVPKILVLTLFCSVFSAALGTEPRFYDAAVIAGLSSGAAYLLLRPAEKRILRGAPAFKNIQKARRFLKILSIGVLGALILKKMMEAPPPPEAQYGVFEAIVEGKGRVSSNPDLDQRIVLRRAGKLVTFAENMRLERQEHARREGHEERKIMDEDLPTLPDGEKL